MTKDSLEANEEDSSIAVKCHDQNVHVGDDVPSYVQPWSNVPNSKIVNSSSAIQSLTRVMFAPCKNMKATNNNIWSSFHLAYAQRCEISNQSLHC
jgi:hypothetical protein